jgi:SAM-dependent methyltransferase
VGAEIGGFAQTSLGEHLMQLTAREGYKAWAPYYDGTPNPLLALETRVLSSVLAGTQGSRILDVGCGTGRWMQRLAASGAYVFGVDFSEQMLAAAVVKPGLKHRCAVADMGRLPVRSDSFDLALCSFALSYAPDLRLALAELARVARRIIVADLHPDAMRRGWKRSFRVQDRTFEIEHTQVSVQELDAAAASAGLIRRSRVEGSFGEPEREMFRLAGKDSAFAEMAACPALLVTSWTK